jgi:N-acetyl-anhydromuramyl-L-alanine amidase AmpD
MLLVRAKHDTPTWPGNPDAGDVAMWSEGPDRGLHPGNVATVDLCTHHITEGIGNAVRWLGHSQNRSGSGWHFTNRRGGALFQHYGLDKRVNHAGGPRSHLRGATNINGRSIGIETENLGRVELRHGKWQHWDRRNKQWLVLPEGREVFTDIDGQTYEALDAGQQATIVRLVVAIAHELPQLWEPSLHVSHAAIDREKSDPPRGAYPWHAIKTNLEGHRPVATSGLIA